MIWPDQLPVVEVFAASLTQWRCGPGSVLGLDYAAVRWIMELHSLSPTRAMLEDLQVMEAEAVRMLNRREG